MQTLITLSAFDFYILFAIAIALITLEIFLYSFVVIWFGLGFIIVGVLSFFYPFESAIWQIALVSILSLIFLFLFRKKLLARFSKSQREVKDNFFDESGFGEFKQGKIFFKGTFWELEPNFDDKTLKDGEKIKVLKVKNNFAFIEKIS
ncbi:NfeD family protein [Aliarcobacter vitoriensis]|uniref:NfeD family protein n=1 Tax=Aliarcobacter vitoriensis TaxID=2011099 RepID=UPI003AAFCB3D